MGALSRERGTAAAAGGTFLQRGMALEHVVLLWAVIHRDGNAGQTMVLLLVRAWPEIRRSGFARRIP